MAVSAGIRHSVQALSSPGQERNVKKKITAEEFKRIGEIGGPYSLCSSQFSLICFPALTISFCSSQLTESLEQAKNQTEDTLVEDE